MIKAKLIEDGNYPQLKKRQYSFSIWSPSSIAIISFAAAFFSTSNWLVWLAVSVSTVCIIFVYFQWKNIRAVKTVESNRTIEFESNVIKIKSKDGEIYESIKLNEVDKVLLRKNYVLKEETKEDKVQARKGNEKEHYIIIENNQQKRQYNFLIESHYMINQLEALIKGWKTAGYAIERI